jgi:16S rRNA (guanine527-N7)-methyltransferase
MRALQEYVQELTGEPLPSALQASFSTYQQELLDWNTRINLTAIREESEVEVKHFMDSLSLYPTLRKHKVASLIDIGTGAGFPGIPLKILDPLLKLVLVESIEKKARFCQHILDTLQLQDAQVVVERAEAVGQNAAHRKQYDCAVARAVAALPVLLEYLLPLVRVGGIAIAQKSTAVEEELAQARNACAILGGAAMHVQQVTIPGLDAERNLVIVEKVKPTPATYPRRIGLPSKKPL